MNHLTFQCLEENINFVQKSDKIAEEFLLFGIPMRMAIQEA